MAISKRGAQVVRGFAFPKGYCHQRFGYGFVADFSDGKCPEEIGPFQWLFCLNLARIQQLLIAIFVAISLFIQIVCYSIFLFLFSLTKIKIIEAIKTEEAPKKSQVFVDSILKFEKLKFNIFSIIATIIRIEDKFLLIILLVFK
ncbi:MAG: hypothetical protein ACE37L_00290 [Allomuricauda sp.]